MSLSLKNFTFTITEKRILNMKMKTVQSSSLWLGQDKIETWLFAGTKDATDMLDDISIKMANCSDNWSDCKDVEFHSGFLQRAKEGMEWVQSVIEAEKPKKVILCGHSLGGAISGTHTFIQNI